MTISRTHIRVIRTDANGQVQSWPSMAIAYRELIGTVSALGSSEHQRIRSALRHGGTTTDRHGFSWKSQGGTVSQDTIAWTDFTFGVELELTAPASMGTVREWLDAAGCGVWRVVSDGSVSANYPRTAMEVVSPVLQGDEGLLKLKKVMDLLREKGCTVNSSCGMHVHIGVRGMAPQRLKKIALAYLANEHHFDSIVPPSRRNNRYCQSNTRIASRSTLDSANTVSSIAQAMNGGNSSARYNSYRYFKLNFQSFVQHGTIEFRQHSGSVESDKACAWVRLIAGFCAQAAAGEYEQLGTRVEFEQFLTNSTDSAGHRFFVARRAKFERLTAAA